MGVIAKGGKNVKEGTHFLECGSRAKRRHRFVRFAINENFTPLKAVSPVAVAPSATALQITFAPMNSNELLPIAITPPKTEGVIKNVSSHGVGRLLGNKCAAKVTEDIYRSHLFRSSRIFC